MTAPVKTRDWYRRVRRTRTKYRSGDFGRRKVPDVERLRIKRARGQKNGDCHQIVTVILTKQGKISELQKIETCAI
jgi:hypothetical protein